VKLFDSRTIFVKFNTIAKDAKEKFEAEMKALQEIVNISFLYFLSSKINKFHLIRKIQIPSVYLFLNKLEPLKMEHFL